MLSARAKIVAECGSTEEAFLLRFVGAVRAVDALRDVLVVCRFEFPHMVAVMAVDFRFGEIALSLLHWGQWSEMYLGCNDGVGGATLTYAS